MTAPDDTLVRELADRADRALPAMSLDPAAVLSGGRRYRRRRVVVRSAVGVAGAAAVALGGLQLGGMLGDDDDAEVARLVSVGDFQVVAATDVVPIEVGGTTVYDTGVAVDPDEPDGATWVLEHVVVNEAELPEGVALDDVASDYLTARPYDAQTGTLGESVVAALRNAPGAVYDGGGMEVAGTLIGLATSDPSYAPQVYLTGGSVDVPAELSRVMVPTFTVPGFDGPVVLLRVSGAERWPYVHLYPAANVGIVLNP